MKLVNISSKVISVGNTILLPDKSTNVYELTPGIKALVDAGHLIVDNSDEEAAKKAAEEAEKKAAEEAAAKKAEEEAKKKAAEEAKAKKAAEEVAKKAAAKAE